ncbi:hypothetical protein SAY86_000080 [Trapa natans]|uniref:Cellulose synthase-like protein G3 n=1 Tax=Trapa natans TaxID=22666 RepID=A0AAN7MMC4_TRANT|nr:hypothetical protein SAY86_000080 [Trapa natans]
MLLPCRLIPEVRVSAVMTNGPLILTLDCDMCSNDPGTVRRVLCYVADPNTDTSHLAYVQFPQMFRGLNRDDIYSCSFRWLFLINPVGMKKGPNYVGTGYFFRRRSLFGPPAMQVSPEIPELSVDHVVERPIQSRETVELAHRVAGSDYDKMTNWGSKVGFRYGSLVEDYYTGYMMQCEGWKSIFCNPDRPAFLGNVPTDLIGMLNQSRRWVVGSLEVTLSRYSVVTYGIRSSLGILMSLSYAQYSFRCLPAVPVTVYSFVPQLALINGSSLFPKASEPWFLLYLFLFLGAYGQDLAEHLLSGHGATFLRWWSEQRTWLIRSLTCFIFGTVDFLLKALGISNQGFNVTSKANHMEQTQIYDRGMFDFGATSPMYVSLSVAALVNLIEFARGLSLVLAMNQSAAVESFALQVLLAGFGVVNGWPLYEAMFLRNDKGKLPTKVTLSSAFLASLRSSSLCGLGFRGALQACMYEFNKWYY